MTATSFDVKSLQRGDNARVELLLGRQILDARSLKLALVLLRQPERKIVDFQIFKPLLRALARRPPLSFRHV
jgi:hypothetical protein